MADRIGELLWESGRPVEFGEFPLAYTALHDLSCDYLLGRLIEQQSRTVAEIQGCVEALRLMPLAQTLAQEALGEAKGHLDSLRELRRSRRASRRWTCSIPTPIWTTSSSTRNSTRSSIERSKPGSVVWSRWERRPPPVKSASGWRSATT